MKLLIFAASRSTIAKPIHSLSATWKCHYLPSFLPKETHVKKKQQLQNNKLTNQRYLKILFHHFGSPRSALFICFLPKFFIPSPAKVSHPLFHVSAVGLILDLKDRRRSPLKTKFERGTCLVNVVRKAIERIHPQRKNKPLICM